MELIFGTNMFGEYEIHEMLCKFTNKWVIHIKAVGLLETKVDENIVWDWYADKTNIKVLNGLINSGNNKEIYIVLDNMDDVVDAYESWFPKESELLDDERMYYVKFEAMSPTGDYYFTNEKNELEQPE